MKTINQKESEAARIDLAERLAEAVAAALDADLKVQERALLIVSGGSTPVPFFKALSQTPLDWARVDITLADERWVAFEDKDSNARLISEHLLQGNAAKASFHSLTTQASTPEEGVDEVAARLESLSWPASALILGMGGDGHTASLFPDSDQLAEGLSTDALVLAAHAPSVPQPRITLSRHRLAMAKRHFLHFTGTDKRAVFARALGSDEVSELPIRAFLNDALALYWAP
ncbi:6-phosphogluconolactonase [Phytohalomonas tamaricis]|uniref:6-phosphogluconolactonase n=1 Tax=Phytohalomonas tamaricis TaxID=2081032 RepID=UPI000D0B592C|nr:6-phosphogluconolactonase [Phytohalomonas tamaricis]